jgi:hypothetical protein
MPPSQSQANRRLTARTACQLSVCYEREGRVHPAMVLDLSTHGCRLRIGEAVQRGRVLKVLFEMPGDGANANMRTVIEGHIIWSRYEGISHQCGIQFDQPFERFSELVARLAPRRNR